MSFVRQFGETPARLWVETIDELSDDECRKALTRLRRKAGAYPCNLGQFLEACGRTSSPRFLGTQIDPSRTLPRQKANREHVDSCLERMRSRFPARPAPKPDEEPETEPVLERDPVVAQGCTCQDGEPPCDVCKAWHERLSG